MIKWDLLNLTLWILYDETIVFNFLEGCICHLFYTVFSHFSICIAFCDRVKSVSNHWKHLNHCNFCASFCEEFHNIKAYGTTTDDGNLLSFHILRIIVDTLYHLKDCCYVCTILVNKVMKTCDRWKGRYRTCCVYNYIWI